MIRSLVLVALLLAPAAVPAQPAFQVADLNTAQPRAADNWQRTSLRAVGTRLFFFGEDGLHGQELWSVDSATGTTAMVKDICPGVCSSAWGGSFAALNGILYFWADDAIHGIELWRSDGTDAGTFLLGDIYPGPLSSIVAITRLVDVDGTLFFAANDGTHGAELWKVNAAGTGVELVSDIRPGAVGSDPHLWLSRGGKLIFSANDGPHGRELWTSDGTDAGTNLIRDLRPNTLSSIPDPTWNHPTLHYSLPDGTFLFGANDGTQGEELWRSDGTDAGTALVEDIASGTESSSPSGFALWNGTIVFAASTSSFGREIWSTDGTEAGTALFLDVTAGAAGSDPGNLTPLGDQLFFFRSYVPQNIVGTLYRTDGTAAGTVLIGNHARMLSPLGDSLLFLTGGDSWNDPTLRLWKTDGSAAGSVLVEEFEPQIPYCLQIVDSRALGDSIYFRTCPSDTGIALWKSDGTPDGTVPVHQSSQTSAFPWPLGLTGGNLIFSANDGSPEHKLFRTDGTMEGTAPLSGNPPEVSWWDPGFTAWGSLENSLLLRPWSDGTLWKTDGTAIEPIVSTMVGRVAVLGSTAIFSRSDPGSGSELWKTDGTAAGTSLLKDILPGPDFSSWPGILGTLGPWVLFSAYGDPVSSYQGLWRTDGTEAGTVQVSASPLNPGNAARLGNGTVFFTAMPGYATAVEIWKTDGTGAGTSLLASFADVGLFAFAPNWNFQATHNRMFFAVDDGAHGHELWVSDGTVAGTHIVKDIVPGPGSSEALQLTAVRNRVFFVANDGVHGHELWTSDGTEAGTRLVKDIVPGPGSPWISDLASMGHALVFAAGDDGHGSEPWVSNGTEAGTHRLQDIAPGALSSNPRRFFRAFPNAYFMASDGTTGFELWAVPRTALGGSFGDVPTSHWAWRQIETLAENGVTYGCGSGADYCPGSTLSRAEMAVFLGRALHGLGYDPPAATGTRFGDVPASHWAGAWIEQIATDGVTQGCSASPPLFCPGSQVTRAEMAIFLLRAKHGGSYTPPPATGTRFEDVPTSYWAAAWIEQLAAEGISLGCTATRFCPGNIVSRAEMAVFLTRAFGLVTP